MFVGCCMLMAKMLPRLSVMQFCFFFHSKADVTALDTESYTPLMIAASEGHVEAFNILLQKDSAIDETDEDGKTVVHLAAEENHVEILKVCY